MPINETKDFIFENYYKRIGFSKESSCYSIKRLKKDSMLLSNKLIEKYPILIMKKKKKMKINKTSRTSYLSTKNL